MAEFENTLNTPGNVSGHTGSGIAGRAGASGYGAGQAAHGKSRLMHIGPVRRLHPLYSPIVRFLKFILPVVALVLVAAVIVWPYIQKESAQLTFGFATGSVDGPADPSMVNPRYTGVDSDQQPFSITADLAKNLVLDTDRVELEMPKADITLGDGTWLLVTADTGVYGRDEALLDLAGNVNIFHDQGYEMITDAVRMDLNARTAESIAPVVGHGPVGELRSEGFRMNSKDQTIYFTGKATLRLYPDALGDN